MRATVPVAAMPRASTTTRSAVGSVPVGSVGSPSFGQRPPQWLTQAVEPSRLIAAPNGATPPVFTRPSSRPDVGIHDRQLVLEHQRHHGAARGPRERGSAGEVAAEIVGQRA